MTVLRAKNLFSNAIVDALPIYSAAQLDLDNLQEGFTQEALNPSSLLGMAGAGLAFRVGQTLSLGIASQLFVPRSLLASQAVRLTSNLAGFGMEVIAFEGITRSSRIILEGADRSLLRWDGEQGFRHGLLNGTLSLGSLKLSGSLFQTSNIPLQHFLQDTTMVASHQAAAYLNLEHRPTGGLAQQYLHAEATLLQMNVGMSLMHSALPGLGSLERNLDRFLQPALHHFNSLETRNENPISLPIMSQEIEAFAFSEKIEKARRNLLDPEKRSALEEYHELASQLPENSPELLSETQKLRNLFKEANTIKFRIAVSSAYESLIHRFTIDSPALRTEAEALRNLFNSQTPHEQEIAIFAYKDLSSRLGEESEEALIGARALRELFENNNEDIATVAKLAYKALSARFQNDSPEIFKGFAALRNLFAQANLDSAAVDNYEALCSRLITGSAEIMTEAQMLRRLLLTAKANKRNILRAYLALCPHFTRGSLEITKGAEFLRNLFHVSEATEPYVQEAAEKAYIALCPHFPKGSQEVITECRELLILLSSNRKSVRRTAEKCFHHFFQLLSPEQVSELIGTCNIDFRDGGNSLSTLKLLLERLKDSPSTDELLSISPSEDVTTIETSLEEFLDSQNVRNKSPEQLGRSQLYTLETGAVLVIKYLREGQDPPSLIREIQWLRKLRNSNVELQSALPFNIHEDNRLLQFPDGKRAIVFTTDRTYYRYLDEAQLKDSEFMDGLCKAIHDINLLARHSVFHTAPIAAFHNTETSATDRPTGDQGRYVVAPDIVFALGNRRGMGRLDNWPQALRFGNLGLSGMRDAEELATLDEIIENIDQWAPELRDLQKRPNAKILYQSLLLGNAYLAATLYIGNRIAEASKSYTEKIPCWKNDSWLETYADQLLEVYATGHAAFRGISLDQARENLSSRADWMRLARQMAFFMTSAYVPFVRENALVRNFPTEIYGPSVYVQGFGPYRRGTFDSNLGFVGPTGDLTQLSLGAVNGQNPLKEFERAWAATLLELI